MPLFRVSSELSGGVKLHPGQRKSRKIKFRADEDGSVLPLAHLCLLSLADNMKELWVKDYADNYLDHYSFRYIMGPFSLLRESEWAAITCGVPVPWVTSVNHLD